ncbi:MAG TPA: hypothetical protein VD905_15005 [Flavobacteriales bacterium]|nr:hypothetical protein [Flavobacteriales bacterium]
MRIVVFIALAFSFISAIYPNCRCNLLLYKNWNEHTSMKRIDKELKKIKRQKGPRNHYKEADLYFLKAWKYHMQGNDSLAKKSFFYSCELYAVEECHYSFSIKSKRCINLCIANYYLEKYDRAVYFYEVYARIGKLPTTCPEIYYLGSLKKVKPGIDIDSAKHAITNDDSHKLNELNQCNCF